jgi:hypothetical protein
MCTIYEVHSSSVFRVLGKKREDEMSMIWQWIRQARVVGEE